MTVLNIFPDLHMSQQIPQKHCSYGQDHKLFFSVSCVYLISMKQALGEASS